MSIDWPRTDHTRTRRQPLSGRAVRSATVANRESTPDEIMFSFKPEFEDMKYHDFMQGVVITADQRDSRRAHDAVPEALDALEAAETLIDPLLGFERTVGDELQGVVRSGTAAVHVVTLLVRLRQWRVGVGIGALEQPLPVSTRQARGPAFIAAREALEAAHRSPVDLALRHDPSPVTAVGALDYGGTAHGRPEPGELAESALWLYAGMLRRRSRQGWEVVDIKDTGATGRQIADQLKISPSAVSQRLRRAAYEEAERGGKLCASLIDACLRP